MTSKTSIHFLTGFLIIFSEDEESFEILIAFHNLFDFYRESIIIVHEIDPRNDHFLRLMIGVPMMEVGAQILKRRREKILR